VKEKTKREYQKPEFTRVKLVPEEAVLGACKAEFVGGEYASTCLGEEFCQLPGS
jgi:hypothetical protein